MPYVLRDAQGAVTSLHRQAPHDQAEFLPDDHPQVQAFLPSSSTAGFAQLDAEFVRVIEDVIDTLIAKNVINITDLPFEVQSKLMSRKNFRERHTGHALRLFDDADGGIAP